MSQSENFHGNNEYLLDGSLVDTTALVDEMASSRRFARIDVTDNDTKKSESDTLSRIKIQEIASGKTYTLT